MKHKLFNVSVISTLVALITALALEANNVATVAFKLTGN